MEKDGLTIVYTGKGKGKTTAALGIALRATGYKKRICMIQYNTLASYGHLYFDSSNYAKILKYLIDN